MHTGEYKSPQGYIITAPDLSDGLAITQVHARALSDGYEGVHPSATAQKLHNFAYDTTKDGFYTRKLEEWSSLAACQQPDAAVRHILLVAQREWSKDIVGFALGRRPLKARYSSVAAPMGSMTDGIAGLYVLPDYQGKGIGSALLKGVMEHLGLVVVLETVHDAPAIAFYKKHGFKEQKWLGGVVGPPLVREGVRLGRLAMSCTYNPYARYDPFPSSDNE